MMKNRLTDQTGNDVDVNVDALLAAFMRSAKAKSIASSMTRSAPVSMAAGRIPGVNWRRHLNSIFMISAPVKPTASDGRKKSRLAGVGIKLANARST